MFSNSNSLSPADVVALGGNGNMWGGEGSWLFIIIILALFGGWGNGNGGFGGNTGSSVRDAYILNSDFATIQRQLSDGFNSIDNALDAQNTGICNLGYTALDLNNRTNTAVMQGFNDTQAQLADCCCKTQSGIERINTGNAMNTASILSAIKDCCCEEKSQFADIKYAMASENCATRQAIADGTRQVIEYMANKDAQNLRDENFALRLQASQSCQNAYLINQLRPTPVPSFNVGVPFGYGYGYGYGYNGTTLA